MIKHLAAAGAWALALLCAAPALAQSVSPSGLPTASAVSATDVFVADQGTCPAGPPACNTLGVTGAQLLVWAHSGLATVATSGSASDLTTGTVPAARLPASSASALGGVKSLSCGASNWFDALSTAGVFTCAQPAATDISGLGTFATQNYATPPAIGSVTPNTGAFTSLSANAGLVVTGLDATTNFDTLKIGGTQVATSGTTAKGLAIFQTYAPNGPSNVDGASLQLTLDTNNGTPTSNFEGVFVASMALTANYTGTAPAVTQMEACNSWTDSRSDKLTNPVPNFYCYSADPITNGNGITAGNVVDINFNAKGSSAAAAAGGTLINTDLNVAMPTGSSATTTNYGLHITGNGGAASTNWAINSTSTANSQITGGLNSTPIGLTTPAAGAFTTISDTGGQTDFGGIITQANITPTLTTGHLAIYGPGGAPTLSNNATGALFVYSVGGAMLTGKGSSCDVSLYDNAFGLALCVPTGTTNVSVGGALTSTTQVLTSAAPTVSAGQVGLGGTTAASSSCGSLSGAAGCLVINVAGTTHYVPYY